VWKLHVPERVRSFVWLIKHDRLMTYSRLNRMHIGNPYCHHCGDAIETTLHVLRDCPLAEAVWLNSVELKFRTNFYTTDLRDWIEQNLNRKRWAEFWATVCHTLWYWRNKLVHDDDFVMPAYPWQVINQRVLNYGAHSSINASILAGSRELEEIRWWPPDSGWIRLNTDGASKGGQNAGCGGVFRGDKGEWICGFSKGLGSCSAYVAELWGVFEGLKLARSNGYRKVELHIDSSSVVSSISRDQGGNVVGPTLLHNIRRLIDQDWEVQVRHSFREANACADALANMACDSGFSLTLYEQCPAQIRSLYVADFVGISTPRLVKR
jgi:ribonuclease HI